MTELKTEILLKEDKPENWTTSSTSGVTFHPGNNIDKEAFVTGLSTDMEEIDSTLETEVTSTINKNLNESFTPRNRAERRAWERELKKKDKKKRVFADNIRQAAERLAYTEMIQRVRKINEEIEKEGAQENEAAN